MTRQDIDPLPALPLPDPPLAVHHLSPELDPYVETIAFVRTADGVLWQYLIDAHRVRDLPSLIPPGAKLEGVFPSSAEMRHLPQVKIVRLGHG